MASPCAQMLAAASISPFSWLPASGKPPGGWWGTERVLWTGFSCSQRKEEKVALLRDSLLLRGASLRHLFLWAIYTIVCVCVCVCVRGSVPEPSKSGYVLSLPRDWLSLQGVSRRSCAVELKSCLLLESPKHCWVLSRTPVPSSSSDLEDSEVTGEETPGWPRTWGCPWRLPSIGCHLQNLWRRGNSFGTAKIREGFPE